MVREEACERFLTSTSIRRSDQCVAAPRCLDKAVLQYDKHSHDHHGQYSSPHRGLSMLHSPLMLLHQRLIGFNFPLWATTRSYLQRCIRPSPNSVRSTDHPRRRPHHLRILPSSFLFVRCPRRRFPVRHEAFRVIDVCQVEMRHRWLKLEGGIVSAMSLRALAEETMYIR